MAGNTVSVSNARRTTTMIEFDDNTSEYESVQRIEGVNHVIRITFRTTSDGRPDAETIRASAVPG